MAFLAELLEYLFKYVVLLAVAVGGVFFGKYMRKRKNAQAVDESNTQTVEEQDA